MRIDDDLKIIADFWVERYRTEKFIWGKEPSPCARDAVARFDSRGAGDVLILGCGYGRDAGWMAEHGLRVTAVDFADEGLKLARSWLSAGRPSEVNFVLDNITELDAPDSHFDAVFSHRTLHLLLSVERLRRALAQIHRVLKPGGCASISVRSPRDPSKERARQSSGEASELTFRPGHKVLYFPESDLTRILGEQFKILDFQEMSERESGSQEYDVRLHYAVLEKDVARQG